jgi:hypothetical protein
MCASFYADEASLFLNPIKEQAQAIFEFPGFFGETSGLRINVSKCTFDPIRCDVIDLPGLLGNTGCNIGSLPCPYLCLHLSFRNPTELTAKAILTRSLAS